MRIVQILDERWDSGLTAYGLSLARGLAARGHDLWIAARPGGPAAESAAKDGLRAAPLSGFRGFVRRENIGVVNAHTGSGHFLGFRAAWGRPSTALVRTQGDARPLRRRWGQGFLYKNTDAVIGASAFLTDQYRPLYPFLSERLSTVSPAVEAPPFRPASDGPARVGVVARLDPVKGHRVFLEAVSQLKDRLKDESFVIAGEDKNIRRSDLEADVRRLGLERWVRFEGRLPDVRAFMENCHVGVVPSVGSEAVSRAALEWLSAGRPVIASRVGCLAEVVEDGKTGRLLSPGDAGALASALAGLIFDAPRRRALEKAAWDSASRRFGMARFVEETEKIYQKALDVRSRR